MKERGDVADEVDDGGASAVEEPNPTRQLAEALDKKRQQLETEEARLAAERAKLRQDQLDFEAAVEKRRREGREQAKVELEDRLRNAIKELDQAGGWAHEVDYRAFNLDSREDLYTAIERANAELKNVFTAVQDDDWWAKAHLAWRNWDWLLVIPVKAALKALFPHLP